MVRHKKRLLFFILLISNLACTDSDLLFKESFLIPENGWDRGNTLKGSWIADKSVSQSTLSVTITHSPGFGYENIYLTGKILKNNQIAWADTFSLQLAKSNAGQWLGTKQGDSWMLADTLSYSMALEKGEEIYFQFSQFSRDPLLKGIKSVEIKGVEILK